MIKEQVSKWMIRIRLLIWLKILIFLRLEKREARVGKGGPGQRSRVSDGGGNAPE